METAAYNLSEIFLCENLIFLQLESLDGSARFSDDFDFNTVSSVDVSFRTNDESVLHDCNSFLASKLLLLVMSILVTDQVVKDRDHELQSRAHGSIVVPLERSNSIVSVYSSFA